MLESCGVQGNVCSLLARILHGLTTSTTLTEHIHLILHIEWRRDPVISWSDKWVIVRNGHCIDVIKPFLDYFMMRGNLLYELALLGTITGHERVHHRVSFRAYILVGVYVARLSMAHRSANGPVSLRWGANTYHGNWSLRIVNPLHIVANEPADPTV